ncbi:MAG: Peptidase, partial [Candidatus Acidoferrum typicum]|nr:Peptidase [Candidatus Acidoferrum typicum]
MKCCFRFLCSVTLFLLGVSLCLAQQQPAPPPDKAAEKPKEEKKPPVPEEKVVQTKHSLKMG